MSNQVFEDPRESSRYMALAMLFCAFLIPLNSTRAEPPEKTVASTDKKPMIQLTLPPEVELKTLIDLVSQRLGVQFLSSKRITINSPKPIPADSLLDVLRSALKMKGLALVDAEPAGWKRIVLAEDLSQIAVNKNGQSIEQLPGTLAVTQIFALAHLAPDRVIKIIEPFLTKKAASTVVVADQNLLIVTDYAPNLQRIARLIELVDQAGPDRVLKFQRIDGHATVSVQAELV